MGNRFSLQQFSPLFQLRNPAGHHYIIIGGQAVNYWAERYLEAEPELQKHAPFTSEDIDFCGNRDDVLFIASQLKLVPAFPPKVAMTALAGFIPIRIEERATNIEIVRRVPGVAANLIDALAVEMTWKDKTVRVLDPISLLACKIELALTVSQKNRQDVEHLQILVLCVRGFLRELLKQVEEGNVPVRGWLGAINRLMKLARTTHGRKVAKKFEFEWPKLLPLAEIYASRNEKIILFREKQLSVI